MRSLRRYKGLMSEIRKLLDQLKDYLKFWPLALAGVYMAGFVTWNRFLTNFGHFEFYFLQTQFISAGILAIVLFYPYIRLVSRILNWRYLRYAVLGIAVFFYAFYFFPLVVFPLIPQSMGGGLPIITSLTGTSSQIMFLEDSFNIPSEKNAEGKKDPIQTKPVCLFFSRENRSIVGPTSGVVGRISTLPDDQFIGFSQPIGGYKGLLSCFEYLYPYSKLYEPICRAIDCTKSF